MKRTCGSCFGCCIAFDVVELNKPAGTKCVHASSAGCAIYDERPEACRKYECGWKYGSGQVADRPDRSGIVINHLGKFVQVHELTRGAMERNPRGRGLVARIRRDWPVVAYRMKEQEQ